MPYFNLWGDTFDLTRRFHGIINIWPRCLSDTYQNFLAKLVHRLDPQCLLMTDLLRDQAPYTLTFQPGPQLPNIEKLLTKPDVEFVVESHGGEVVDFLDHQLKAFGKRSVLYVRYVFHSQRYCQIEVMMYPASDRSATLPRNTNSSSSSMRSTPYHAPTSCRKEVSLPTSPRCSPAVSQRVKAGVYFALGHHNSPSFDMRRPWHS